jgi:hypothetical protein
VGDVEFGVKGDFIVLVLSEAFCAMTPLKESEGLELKAGVMERFKPTIWVAAQSSFSWVRRR